MDDQSKHRILIVDDDEDNVRLLRSVFQEADFEVMAAFDGLEGLDLATKHVPDVIITGIIMPRMSGFDMIRNLQNNVPTASIPVLIYSHLGREEDRLESQRLGARDFLVRGLVTPHNVLERAQRLLSRGKSFYIEFDPQRGDARNIQEAFGFKPYFECADGSRMVIKLEPQGPAPAGATQEFKAAFVCRSQEKPNNP